MRLLKRQFGKRFVEIASQCPTVVADVEELRRRKVKIRRTRGSCGGEARSDTNTIYIIGYSCSVYFQILTLVHEKEHICGRQTMDVVPGVTSRKAYIRDNIRAEVDAYMHEVPVVQELLDAGHKLDDASMLWYRRYRRGGRKAIYKGVVRLKLADVGLYYPDYYGQCYDERVKPEDRIP